MGGIPPRREEALPDFRERSLVTGELDRNLLVEAAAGTGKTTCMVERMLALLRTGRCRRAGNMAAITFTRKAAAEIRARFQLRLEEEVRISQGEEGERLGRALEEIDQCFTGTIHSFCARLLRERPVEAGVDVSFREIDEQEDKLLRRRAWEEFLALSETPDHQDVFGELAECGLALSQLEDSFYSFLDYPDVEEWPVPESVDTLAVMDRARRELAAYMSHLENLRPLLPEQWGRDELIPKLRRLPRVVSHHDLEVDRELAEVLEYFDKRFRDDNINKTLWRKTPGLGRGALDEELRRWDAFREDIVIPALRAWRERRYAAALRALASARSVYDRLRAERGLLNFQDLLLKAAALLRGSPDARRYFQSRFTHVLVDEFQDTDPVQAEVILLLTSDDPEEEDWRECRPRPGSLFLVGDPKQSIYRFRRADITVYNEVKDIFRRTGGLLVRLSANFRSAPELVDWVNRTFAPRGDPDAEEGYRRFPKEDGPESPAYVALLHAREEASEADLRGIYRLPIPAECSNKDMALDYEADFIARFIRHALDTGLRLPRSFQELERGKPPHAEPSDFLIITPTRKNLALFARKLQEYGVPHQVSGGQSLNEVPELTLLRLCLESVLRPDDPLALVSVLRSELFGLSDADLYDFKRQGGSFSFHAPIPTGLTGEQEEAFRDAFHRLRRYHAWLRQAPPVTALEMMVDDLGLLATAAARPGGEVQAGGLAKALELLRDVSSDAWSFSHLTDYLERLVEAEEGFDAVSVLSEESPAVRLMNLHRAKGLEAPVVFLADTYGERDRTVLLHVDRSRRRTTGYLAVVEKDRFGNVSRVLAHPEGWEDMEARERGFRKAERLRLRYVAATRAGAACVISMSEKGRYNFWKHFTPELEGCPALPDPGAVQPRLELEREPSRGDLAEVSERLEERVSLARTPTYQVRAAKEFSLQGGAGKAARPGQTGEEKAPEESLPYPKVPGAPEDAVSGVSPFHGKEGVPTPGTVSGSGREEGPGGREGLSSAEAGMAGACRAADEPAAGSGEWTAHTPGPDAGEGGGPLWGEVVHLLLRAAVEEPAADLLNLARSALREKGLPEALAGEACRLAEGITGSAVWRRARESECFLAEVPFQVMEEGGDVPTVLRGAVDLAFREEGGWVLVDYKTDRLERAGDEALRRLAERYAPQLHTYCRAWERCTGQPVKEAFLYFLNADSLVRVR